MYNYPEDNSPRHHPANATVALDDQHAAQKMAGMTRKVEGRLAEREREVAARQ